MRHAFAFVALVSTLSAAAPALAQSNGSARCSDAPTDRTAYCFDTTDVTADDVRPNDARTALLRRMHGTSLLRIRPHFVNEMLKSVENL